MTKRTLNFARILASSSSEAANPGLRSGDHAYRTAADGAHGALALTEDDAGAILEVAWLMANANGRANVDETAAFEQLAAHLRPDVPVSTLLAELRTREAGEAAARRAAAKLTSRTAREAAYRAAYAIRVVDLETNDAEAELDRLLVEVLGLGERAGDLAFDVNDALLA